MVSTHRLHGDDAGLRRQLDGRNGHRDHQVRADLAGRPALSTTGRKRHRQIHRWALQSRQAAFIARLPEPNCFRAKDPGSELYALQKNRASPEALDKDVVEAAIYRVYRDPCADRLQPVSLGEGGELAALVGVHDLGRAEVTDGLVHDFQTYPS